MAQWLLVVAEDGHGKRIEVQDIPLTRRGRAGAKIAGGPFAVAIVVTAELQLVLASASGRTLRLAVTEVPIQSRRARGPLIFRLADHDRVVAGAATPPDPA